MIRFFVSRQVERDFDRVYVFLIRPKARLQQLWKIEEEIGMVLLDGRFGLIDRRRRMKKEKKKTKKNFRAT